MLYFIVMLCFYVEFVVVVVQVFIKSNKAGQNSAANRLVGTIV